MIAFQPTSVEKIREEFRRMTDEKLVKTGKLLRGLCSPEANFGKPPREVWVMQLKEARAEWRRRHPKDEPNEPAG